MLDLTALKARFRNLSLLGCKAAGEKVLLFYPAEAAGWKKRLPCAHNLEAPEGQGLVGDC
jgi:hypothetical protein